MLLAVTNMGEVALSVTHACMHAERDGQREGGNGGGVRERRRRDTKRCTHM